jgi:hypothetical protein
MKMNDTSKSLFIKCLCSTHLFEIERSDDNEFNLTFWHYSRQDTILGWRERLRWIWRIFRTGNPWSDGIIISDEQAKTIVNYINKHLPKE